MVMTRGGEERRCRVETRREGDEMRRGAPPQGGDEKAMSEEERAMRCDEEFLPQTVMRRGDAGKIELCGMVCLRM